MSRGRPVRGITLVEMVAAAGLLALIVAFGLGLIPSFKVSNRRANAELQAGLLAQSLLDLARSQPFSEVVDVPNDPPATTGPFTSVTMEGVVYTPSQTVQDTNWTVPPAPPASPVAMKSVRVTVRWQWGGRTMEAFRETLITKVQRS